jgi:uncharacterized protein RhaS with RHS repeats
MNTEGYSCDSADIDIIPKRCAITLLRYYSPALGRFLTRDNIANIDIENPQSLNLYEYADDNPVSNVDPNGKDAASVVEAIDYTAAAASFIPGADVVAWTVAGLATGAYIGYKIYQATFNPSKYPWNGLPGSGSHPYNPPVDKTGNPCYPKSGTGALDSSGNVWDLDKQGRSVGNPHWDVQHPNGSHTNVNPEGSDNPGEVNHGSDNFPE